MGNLRTAPLGLLLVLFGTGLSGLEQACGQVPGGAKSSPTMTFKEERFDKDPLWEGYNNRLKPDPKEALAVVQDFGYSDTSFAGGEKGEVGGQVWRCTTPAFYADKIPVKSFKDKLTASGKFVFTSVKSGSGLWFGWFNAKQVAGSARPTNSLGLNFGFQGDGGSLKVMASNEQGKFCGTSVTPHIGGKFRFAPLSPNTQYLWMLSYDPQANGGKGRIEFTIKSAGMSEEGRRRHAQMQAQVDALPAEERAKFGAKHGRPDFDGGEPFIVDLPAGFKDEGSSFDHFGMMNILKEGQPVSIYFDDLVYDGKTEDFAKDPRWEDSGNRARFQQSTQTGCHDFGFIPASNFAGGASPGEIGGIFWRQSRAYGYYADRVGPLTLDDPLEARGKLMLKVGSPDSEMCFGWFNSEQKEIPKDVLLQKKDGHLARSGHFLGVYLAGPSRLGRCLIPAVMTGKGTKLTHKKVDETPRPTPGDTYEWSLKYDPAAEGGNGVLTVSLADQSARLVLDANPRKEGATFDRFGFSSCGGAGMVHIFFDDLEYTAGLAPGARDKVARP